MSLKVVCAHCSEQMILQFVKVGEQFACRQCGAFGIVPENAVQTDDISSVTPSFHPPDTSTSADGAIKASTAGIANAQPTSPGIRVFSIVAATANGLYLFFELVGLSTGEIALDFASKAVVFMLFVVGGANIAVLAGGLPYLRKALIACNLVILIGLALLWLTFVDDPDVKVGAVMLLIVGATSALALSVCHKESWLSLRIERTRLEEMKRVADLRKELQLPEQTTDENQ